MINYISLSATPLKIQIAAFWLTPQVNLVLSQDPSNLLGKVLRINKNGTIPSDNPFPNSPVYTLGHRNMFGIAFDNKDNIGIVTENGDVLYDEINLIKKGGNYGFPTFQPANISPELSNSTVDIKPLRSYWKTQGPTQALTILGINFHPLKIISYLGPIQEIFMLFI